MVEAKIILVTGASSGIGAAIAKRLAGEGHTVFGTSRKARNASPAEGVRMLRMDVCSDGSVARAVAALLKAAGRIDVLVNNAGFGLAGAIEDTAPDDMRRQLETNLLGPLRVCQAVLPAMRKQGRGRIIQISSLGARVGIPFQGAYCTSKFALEGMSEALSIEVKPFGIDVVMVEPGDTNSNFPNAREWTALAKSSATYAARAKHAVAVMTKAEHSGPPADKVARLISRAIAAKAPKLRYVCATPIERAAITAQRLLPGRMFEAIVGAAYALPKAK